MLCGCSHPLTPPCTAHPYQNSPHCYAVHECNSFPNPQPCGNISLIHTCSPDHTTSRVLDSASAPCASTLPIPWNKSRQWQTKERMNMNTPATLAAKVLREAVDRWWPGDCILTPQGLHEAHRPPVWIALVYIKKSKQKHKQYLNHYFRFYSLFSIKSSIPQVLCEEG